MTWNLGDVRYSLQFGSCLICKKAKKAKEMGIALTYSPVYKKHSTKGLVCIECFERDVFLVEKINKEQKDNCGVCFVCEENFQEPIPYDATEIKETYTFEIINNNYVFCVHAHKECYETSAGNEWIFDDTQRDQI